MKNENSKAVHPLSDTLADAWAESRNDKTKITISRPTTITVHEIKA